MSSETSRCEGIRSLLGPVSHLNTGIVGTFQCMRLLEGKKSSIRSGTHRGHGCRSDYPLWDGRKRFPVSQYQVVREDPTILLKRRFSVTIVGNEDRGKTTSSFDHIYSGQQDITFFSGFLQVRESFCSHL